MKNSLELIFKLTLLPVVPAPLPLDKRKSREREGRRNGSANCVGGGGVEERKNGLLTSFYWKRNNSDIF